MKKLIFCSVSILSFCSLLQTNCFAVDPCYITITVGSCSQQLSNTTIELLDTDCDAISDNGLLCYWGWKSYPDNCPDIYNPEQGDLDNDNLGDVCDTCTDVDGDGYGYPIYPANTCIEDNCPNFYNPNQDDRDADGIGNLCDSDTTGDGLVAYYPFNGNANDETGNGNNGTVYGATLTADRNGNPNSAFGFSGTEQEKINCGHLPYFNFNTGVTFAVWIYPTIENAGAIIMKWAYGKEDKYLWMRDQEVHFYLFNCFDLVQLESSTIPLNEWTFVVATYDGSIAKIYINGVLDTNKNASGDVADWTADMYIGYNSSGRTYNYEKYTSFNGSIDDVRIYNRALSESEILELYEETTLIKLSSFYAKPKVDKIILSWTTESEINNAGFNLYRAETIDGPYLKINNGLIPAKGSLIEGASY